jgi:hypothetical protein
MFKLKYITLLLTVTLSIVAGHILINDFAYEANLDIYKKTVDYSVEKTHLDFKQNRIPSSGIVKEQIEFYQYYSK